MNFTLKRKIPTIIKCWQCCTDVKMIKIVQFDEFCNKIVGKYSPVYMKIAPKLDAMLFRPQRPSHQQLRKSNDQKCLSEELKLKTQTLEQLKARNLEVIIGNCRHYHCSFMTWP